MNILMHIYPGIYRWSQGLLFHQAMVDCARAAILLPLGSSILNCQPVNKCSLVETAFLLLVTVSTVNMLTTVLNDSPVFPESDEEADLTAPLLMDSPQVKIIARTFNVISVRIRNDYLRYIGRYNLDCQFIFVRKLSPSLNN